MSEVKGQSRTARLLDDVITNVEFHFAGWKLLLPVQLQRRASICSTSSTSVALSHRWLNVFNYRRHSIAPRHKCVAFSLLPSVSSPRDQRRVVQNNLIQMQRLAPVGAPAVPLLLSDTESLREAPPLTYQPLPPSRILAWFWF